MKIRKNSIVKKNLIFGISLLLIGPTILLSHSTLPSAQTTSAADIQLFITDDGSGNPTDKKIDVPSYVPSSGITPQLIMNFTITGTNTSGTTAFYGDDPWEDWKNISVTGDILYPVDSTTLYHMGAQGDWTCCITPTKPAGLITLSIIWPGNGSATNSIQIINGTSVTPQVESFPAGSDFNLTVAVQDIDAAPVKTGALYLLWEEDDLEFNHTIGNNKPGNGMNGIYTFLIRKEEQGDFLQKNITIAAQMHPGADYWWGYAIVTMTYAFFPPQIQGPHYGKTNTEYTFSLGEVTDPEGDQLYCFWDWGDGNYSGWLGPYESGYPLVASHIWTQPGNYTIKVKLKDSTGQESDWSEPFTIYITQKMFLLGSILSFNMTDETTIFDMVIGIMITHNPMKIRILFLSQILILNHYSSGSVIGWFIVGQFYGLVLSNNQ